MCEQCVAKTEMYLTTDSTPPIAGAYWLVRATVDGSEMKKDDWGLVTCNDPDFVFTTTPWPNPFFHTSDEEVDMVEELDPVFGKLLDKWDEDVEKFAKEMSKHTRDYWALNSFGELTINCLKAGMPQDTRRVANWLFQHIGEQLVAKPHPIPDPIPETIPETIPTK